MTELVECGQLPAVQLPSPLFMGDAMNAGTVLDTSQGSGPDWADRVVASLAPGERALVVLPFRPDAPGIAHRVALTAAPASALVASRLPAARHQVTERPSGAGYADQCRA